MLWSEPSFGHASMRRRIASSVKGEGVEEVAESGVSSSIRRARGGPGRFPQRLSPGFDNRTAPVSLERETIQEGGAGVERTDTRLVPSDLLQRFPAAVAASSIDARPGGAGTRAKAAGLGGRRPAFLREALMAG